MSSTYKIELAKNVTKELQKLNKKDLLKISLLIERLKTRQLSQGVKKLKGVDNLYRIRYGNYRIIYTIKNTSLTIIILKVAHRSIIYRDL